MGRECGKYCVDWGGGRGGEILLGRCVCEREKELWKRDVEQEEFG
jgi:hypothetical protein